MKFTLIFGYRNRESARVKRCLDSLARQTNNDFDVIFVDYGSDKEIAREIKEIVESYSFTTYFYNDTRGYNWNRSHALNTGIRKSTGTFTVTTDVDLIYPAHFIETLATEADESKLLHGLAYYMPENFNDYDNIDQINLKSLPNVVHGQETALGMCQVVSTNIIKRIGGFDEYFRIWGVEDIDINKRLKNQNITMHWLDLEKYRLVHQWHPIAQIGTNIAQAPLNWFQVMWDYYEKKEIIRNPDENWGQCLTIDQRKALQMVLKGKEIAIPVFEFKSPVEYSMNQFIGKFHRLETGEAIRIDQFFGSKTIHSDSLSGRLVKGINQFLKKRKTSYRLMNYQEYESPSLGYYNVRDLLFYFLFNHRKSIADYYFNYGEDHILAIFVKA